MAESTQTTIVKKRFYRKRVPLFRLIDKIRLWPSRKGQLHGVRSIVVLGEHAIVTTFCNKEFMISNSSKSRSARWLRNKWFTRVCSQCGVPDWKLEKYSSTFFKRHQGSVLSKEQTS